MAAEGMEKLSARPLISLMPKTSTVKGYRYCVLLRETTTYVFLVCVCVCVPHIDLYR